MTKYSEILVTNVTLQFKSNDMFFMPLHLSKYIIVCDKIQLNENCVE